MKATITNIILEDNHFRVFVRFENDVEESNIFGETISADEIKAWVDERRQYFLDLIAKEKELQSLVGEEI